MRAYRMDICFLLLVALATTVTIPIVGTFLLFSLMVAPAGAAQWFTDRPHAAMALSVALALAVDLDGHRALVLHELAHRLLRRRVSAPWPTGPAGSSPSGGAGG